MNVQRKSQTVGDLTKLPGRTSAHMVRARETKGCLLITHPDRPRPSTLVNDNYCVNLFKVGLLAGSKIILSVVQSPPRSVKTLDIQIPQTQVANFSVVNPVLSAPGTSQKKDIRPGIAECYQRSKLEYVKDVFCVNQFSFVKPVTSVQTVASNLPVGARLQNFWKALETLGAGPKTRLHPPLSDPAKLDKVTDNHKLLCQSPQEPLPGGGIASAYEQKCSRAGQKPRISGVLQPTFLGSQTKQSLETYTGPEQFKSIPQDRKIYNGDTRNHQDVPPTRGVGYLNRFQGCLLPHTNTSTVQGISEISYPGSIISVQGTTFQTVHSFHGVHCCSKGGETDGHAERYKDPPIPRRLVGQSQIPPNLSPAYRQTNRNLSETGLDGEL